MWSIKNHNADYISINSMTPFPLGSIQNIDGKEYVITNNEKVTIVTAKLLKKLTEKE
jgi:hypothetical protein